MELVWYGLGCFRINDRGFPAVVTDPFSEEEVGLTLPKNRSEIVTSSILLEEPRKVHWKGMRGVSHTLAAPGEYEIGGVFITGIATFRDRKRGAQSGENVVYAINMNDVVVCHLGELGHVPTQTQVETMGAVDVLLVPVGIPGGLTPSMASEVVSMVEPGYVIPMNYKFPGLSVPRNSEKRFLKEMGVARGEEQESFKLSSGSVPDETQVVLLRPQVS
jgi:L-ascorbate metabolism protein UlaG (beta-lactamase superfamily)